MNYSSLNFKKPLEAADYDKCSTLVVKMIDTIIDDSIKAGHNKIIINTNLKLGLPMENINKIAGPFVEAWAFEQFFDAFNNSTNSYKLTSVKAQGRLNKADVILQFSRPNSSTSSMTAEVDVKATAQDISSSGKSPNITSFAIIRTAYVTDPDYIFLILSLKHKVYSTKNVAMGLMDGIMEVVAYNTYDLKYISERDFAINPALGTGQLQINDIHKVSITKRSTWEFCQILDMKYLKSSRKSFGDWLYLAKKFQWIK
jgi:hypothetical protein